MSSFSCRDAIERASRQFYDELSQKVLAKTSNLQYQDGEPASVCTVKSSLGLNYKALGKALELLSERGYIELSSTKESSERTVEEIVIEVTRSGELETRRYQYQKVFSSF